MGNTITITPDPAVRSQIQRAKDGSGSNYYTRLLFLFYDSDRDNKNRLLFAFPELADDSVSKEEEEC